MIATRADVRALSILVLVFAGALACGDDDAAGSTGADGGGVPSAGRGGAGGAAGGGSGSGAGSSGGDCLDPAELDAVVTPRELTDGSVIYRMELDGDDLFFSSIDTLYRVSADGGEPEVIYTRDLAIGIPFWVRQDDLLVLSGASTLLSVPRDGGEPTTLGMLPYRISGSLDTRVDMIVDGDYAYAKSESGGFFDDDPLEITYFEVDLETLETRDIAVTDIGQRAIMVKLGDALFIASTDPGAAPSEGDGIGAFAPDLLYRIPIEGGEPEAVPLDGEPLAFNLIGADDAQLFMIASAEEQFTRSGIYRADPEGGTPEQLVETLVLFNATFEYDRTDSRNLLRDLDHVYAVPTSDATAPAEPLFCVSGEVHSMAANDEAAWISLFDDQDRASVVLVPLD